MTRQSLPISVLLAALIGAAHTYLLTWAWVHISVHTPLPQWLASHGVTGVFFQCALFPADFLTNMVLSIPAGYLLCELRPAKLMAYLLAALLPGLLWQYRLVLVDITLLNNWQLFPGVLLAALPLPATALIIRRFVGGAPNNSFKPTPLRGAA